MPDVVKLEPDKVRSILRAMEEEDRLWRGARAQVGELLAQYEALLPRVQELQRQEQQVRGNIQQLEQQFDADKSAATRAVENDVRAERERLEASLATLRANVSQAQKEGNAAVSYQKQAEHDVEAILLRVRAAEKREVDLTASIETLEARRDALAREVADKLVEQMKQPGVLQAHPQQQR